MRDTLRMLDFKFRKTLFQYLDVDVHSEDQGQVQEGQKYICVL